MTPEIIVDPETDATATYAVSPSSVRALTARVVCAPRPEWATTRTPLTGGPIAALPLSTPADVTMAVAAARAAQRGWARTPMEVRSGIMLRFHDLVLERQVEILDYIQLESGKTRAHAFEEIIDVAAVARHYARSAGGYLRARRHAGAFPLLSQSVESAIPKGVVGVVSPWNFPFTLAITDLIPALMAGNAVVLRPDNQSGLTALAAVALLDEAAHLAEEEREQQRADVGSVDVGVGQDDHLAVAGLVAFELLTDTGADCGDQRLDLDVLEDLVDAGPLNIERLAAQGQDRLVLGVAAAHGRTTSGVTLHDEQLGLLRILGAAVGELARQPGAFQRGLATDCVASLASCDAGALRLGGLGD